MKFVRICIIMSLLVGFAGCSIKENRMVCPCHMYLDMTGIDKETIEYAAVTITGSDGFIFNDLIPNEDFSQEYIVDVPRGSVNVWVSNGIGDVEIGPEGIVVPEGRRFPDLYLHYSQLDTDFDSVVETVVMGKSHCKITICLCYSGEVPFQLELKGNVNGYGADGKVSKGVFNCAVDLDENGACEISVPRQDDNSLRLQVSDGTGVLRVFALGEYISASGYDWTERDLKDITVSLDYALTGMTVAIQGWENEYSFSVII